MRNLNKVCNKEIEEPTGQETIREREKKYKKERMCALSSIWDQPINREKKNMLSKGKEIRTYGNRHLDWTPLRTLIDVGSRSRPLVGLYGKKENCCL